MKKISKKAYFKYANAIIFILLLLVAIAIFAFVFIITSKIGTGSPLK